MASSRSKAVGFGQEEEGTATVPKATTAFKIARKTEEGTIA
jgi:hypothetical protein